MHSISTQRKQYFWLMVSAIVFGGLDFLTSTSYFLFVMLRGQAVNLPNILFAAFRTMIVVMPVAMLIGRSRHMAKIFRLKILTGFWAVFAMYGFLWIFNYLSAETIYELFEFDKIYEYQRGVHRYYFGNYLQWGSYRLSATVCSIIYCIMLAVISMTIHKKRKYVAGCFVVTFAFLVIAPFVIRFIAYRTGYTLEWLKSNVFALLSFASMTAAICVAARSERAWAALVWDQ